MLNTLLLAIFLSAPTMGRPQQVVFCASANGRQNLYVINIDGTGLRQITTSPAEDDDPSWSPDGSLILFTRIPGHKKNENRSDGHLWSVRPDGTHLSQLTSGPVFDRLSAWFPDGKRIAFMRQALKTSFYDLDLRTKKVTKPSVQMFAPSWAPDRKWIAYVRSESQEEEDNRDDIWLTRSTRESGQKLTNFRGGVDAPQWAPNGKQIAFKLELPSGPESGSEICVMSLTTRKIRVLTSGRHLDFEDPRWSPDGKRLCFLETDGGHEPMTNSSFRQLYVIDAYGSANRRLTDHRGDDSSPQWTRDGKSILVQGERGMKRVKDGITGTEITYLIVVDADGKGERILPTGMPVFSPVLSP